MVPPNKAHLQCERLRSYMKQEAGIFPPSAVVPPRQAASIAERQQEADRPGRSTGLKSSKGRHRLLCSRTLRLVEGQVIVVSGYTCVENGACTLKASMHIPTRVYGTRGPHPASWQRETGNATARVQTHWFSHRLQSMSFPHVRTSNKVARSQ